MSYDVKTGFVGFIKNLDPSHYILFPNMMSLQILRKLQCHDNMVCSVIILNILRHSTVIHLVDLSID